ncbi:MAG TPA: hypothetical protein VJB56_00865 [Candidatus Paceibacterota bacterium]
MSPIIDETRYREAAEKQFKEEETRYAEAAKERHTEEETVKNEEEERAALAEEQMALEQAYAGELHENRLRDYISVRAQVEKFAARVAIKLTRKVEEGSAFGVLMFVIFLAILKDGLLDIGLDFLGIGLIPILGQIPGWFVSAIIYMLIGGNWGKKMGLKMVFFIFDALPLFEELPLTIIFVCWWWYDVRKEARKAERQLVALHEKTPQELMALDEEYEDEELEYEESYA